MISVVLPSRKEKYLKKTIESLILNSKGEIEILPVLDGYELEKDEIILDERVKYIKHKESIGMRAAINSAVREAKGKYIMKLDAHCIVAPNFDEVLVSEHQDNWVQIPRRYRIDEVNWEIDKTRPVVDYEHFVWPKKFKPPILKGSNWEERKNQRKDILIDDTLTFQGSCWFMTRDWFMKNNFLHVEGYYGLPQQEAEEIGLTTWLNGGRVVTNKKTWYAHFRKKERGYFIGLNNTRRCYEYSYQHWVIENQEKFIEIINKFMPIPGWPNEWEKYLWEEEKI